MYAGCSIKEQGLVIWDDKIWFHVKNTGGTKSQERKKRRKQCERFVAPQISSNNKENTDNC